MASLRDSLLAVQGLGEAGSSFGNAILKKQQSDDEEKKKLAQEKFLAEYRPLQLAGTASENTTKAAQAAGATMAQAQAAALDEANRKAIEDANVQGWEVTPEEIGNLVNLKSELKIHNLGINKAGGAAISPKEFLDAKRETKKLKGIDVSQKEADVAKTKAETLKALREKPAGPTKTAKGYDDQGKEFLYDQSTGNFISYTGGTRPAKQGGAPATPSDLADKAESGMNIIDQMIGNEKNGIPRHPGFTGAIGVKGLSQGFGLLGKPVAGSKEADFNALKDQITGQAFLEARQLLKGGGAITDFEGRKAEGAVTRMSNSQSEGEFVKAAKEFRDVLEKAAMKAREKAAAKSSPAPAEQTDEELDAALRAKGIDPATGEKL
jgi:hypothetical protein